MFNLLSTLLLLEGQHSFVTKILSQHCSNLDDEKTKILLEKIQDASITSFIQLMWVQKQRNNIKDFSIIKLILNETAKHCKKDEDKLEISKFIGNTFYRISLKGLNWFSLLSDIEVSTSLIPHSFQELIESTYEIIKAINNINKLILIDQNFENIEPNIKSFSEFCSNLLNSNFEHLNIIGQLQIKRSITFFDKENIQLMINNPIFLMEAIKIQNLCSNVIISFVQNISNLPKEFWKNFDENIPFELHINHEEALKLAPDVLFKCNGNTKFQLQEKICISIFNYLDDDEQIDIIKNHINKIFKGAPARGIEVISTLIKTSSHTSFDILTLLSTIAKNISKTSHLEILRKLIDDCCLSNEIPTDLIIDTIYATLNQNYDSTASGKKKVEKALIWANKLVSKLGKEISRDKFKDLIEKVVKTGSRNASNMIKQLSNSK